MYNPKYLSPCESRHVRESNKVGLAQSSPGLILQKGSPKQCITGSLWMRKGLEWPFDLDCPWLVDPLRCLRPPWVMLLHQELTTVCPWYPPRTVVRDARLCVWGARPCSQNSSSSFAIVRFPVRFSVLSCYFVRKMGVYLALLRGRICSKTLFHSQKLHWRSRR